MNKKADGLAHKMWKKGFSIEEIAYVFQITTANALCIVGTEIQNEKKRAEQRQLKAETQYFDGEREKIEVEEWDKDIDQLFKEN